MNNLLKGMRVRRKLKEEGHTVEELAQKIGISVKDLNDILDGKKSFTKEQAEKARKNIGLPGFVWNGLERKYGKR